MPESMLAPCQSTSNSTEAPKSWILPAPEGAYGRVPTWVSRVLWLAAVSVCLDSAQGRDQLRVLRVSAEVVQLVAKADADTADHRTGRDVATAHDTVAVHVGRGKATVRRARTWLTSMRLAVVLTGGRYLTNAERDAAKEAHGARQVRAASTRALTVPRHVVNAARALVRRIARKARRTARTPRPSSQREHLPPLGGNSSPKSSNPMVTNAPAARARGQQQESSSFGLPVKRLAAEVDAVIPSLTRGRHIGHLVQLLDSLGVDPSEWSGRGLVQAIDADNRGSGRYSIPRDNQRHPLRLFAHQLRRVLGAAVPDRVQQKRRRETADQMIAQGRAEVAEATRLRRAAASPDQVATITAGVRDQLRLARTKLTANQTGSVLNESLTNR